MNNLIGALFFLALLGSWLAGAVLASGWMKVVAAFVPFYARYLVIEKAMHIAGLVP